jgi:hypothetical protein
MTITEKNITVSEGVTRVAGHLKITPTMVDDFLIDPVLGIYVIMGVKLDVFQEYATRIKWWVPNVLDSSGFGTGKTFRVFLVTNLRAMLIPEQDIVVYYQTFDAGKKAYWEEYKRFGSGRAPIFAAQLGRMNREGDEEGKDNTRGASCYHQNFKNSSAVHLPAPNWMQKAIGQASLTFSMGVVDEWTKVETMTPSTARTTGEGGHLVGGIDEQIIGRIRKPSFNQFHPLWGNHVIFTATAESTQHPGYSRYRQFEKEVAAGNPNYALITSCFKDFSNVRTETDIRIDECECQKQPPSPRPSPPGEGEGKRLAAPACSICGGTGRALKSKFGKPFREQVPNYNAIKMLKGRTRAHFQREGLGLWARDTRGWYSEEALDRCVKGGIAAGTQPECARNAALADAIYFEGVDSAPAQGGKADDGAKVVLRLRPKPGLGRPVTSVLSDWLFEYVWAYRVRGPKVRKHQDEGVFFAQRTSEWSGLIHRCHQHFGLAGIMMDSQGGGQFIWPELNKGRQTIGGIERECVPIATVDDSSVGNAHFILTLFMREYLEPIWPILAPGVDSLLTAMHTAYQESVEHAELLFPKPFNERPRSETEGWPVEQQWALKNLDTMRGQLIDIQVATKDNGEYDLTRNGAKRFLATGKKDLAYAGIYAYVRALLWLKAGELEFAVGSQEEAGIYSM